MPALDDPHGRIAGQLATEFQFGLEIGDLLLQEAGLLIDGLGGQAVGGDVGLLGAGEHQALQQQGLAEHVHQGDIGRQAARQDVLVTLVAQRLDDAAGDRQGIGAGRSQVLGGQWLTFRQQLLQRLELLVGLLDQRGQADACSRHRLLAAFTGLLLLFAQNPGGERGGFLGRTRCCRPGRCCMWRKARSTSHSLSGWSTGCSPPGSRR